MDIVMKINYSFQKKKKYFKKLNNEMLDKIEDLSNKINFDDLKYTSQSSGRETDFSKVKHLLVFLNDIKTG